MFLPFTGFPSETHAHIQDRAVRHPDCSADAHFDVLSHELFSGRTVRNIMVPMSRLTLDPCALLRNGNRLPLGVLLHDLCETLRAPTVPLISFSSLSRPCGCDFDRGRCCAGSSRPSSSGGCDRDRDAVCTVSPDLSDRSLPRDSVLASGRTRCVAWLERIMAKFWFSGLNKIFKIWSNFFE